jgi:nitrite reductase (NADH) small subunit
MSEWVDVAPTSLVEEGQVKAVTFGGRAIAVARVEGQIYAIEDTCPHRGASLSLGDLSGCFLYCPLHAWSFDLRSGVAFFPQGIRVERFNAKEDVGRIWLSRR